MSDKIVVRGTASDPDGIAAVRVNGVPAVLTTPEGATGFGAPAGSFARAQSEVRALNPMHGLADSESTTEADAEVEWVVEVDLEPGENALVVAVEDSAGDETTDADMVEATYIEVPIAFTLDASNTRVVGLSWTLTSAGRAQRLVEHDYGSGTQVVYPQLGSDPALSCFRPAANDFYFLELEEGESWALKRFNLDSGQESSTSIDPDVLAPGEGYDATPYLRRLICGDTTDHAYLLANYTAPEGPDFGSGGFAKSRVVRLDLLANVESILTESNETPPWLAMDMALAGANLVSLGDLNELWPLTLIEANGSRGPLAESVSVGGMTLAAALDLQRVYVVTPTGIVEVDLDAETKAEIASAGPEEPLLFSQATSMALDLDNGRIIVGDQDLDALVAVDVETGERSEFLARKVGQGPLFIAPRALGVTADETLAYVVDDGGNRPERLFEVDLTTGDRRVIGAIQQPLNVPVTGLALDEENRRVFVARQDILQAVDLDTEAASPIVSVNSSELTGILALAYDAANDRLLVGDASQALVAIDPVTLQRDVVSQAENRGDGPPFAVISSIALTADGAFAYVANRETDSIFFVNLENGDRELLSFACLAGMEPETLRQVLLDQLTDQLIVLHDKLFVIDLSTQACAAVPSVPFRVSPLHVEVTPAGRMLAAVFNALGVIDTQSGDAAIVSK